MVLSAAVVMTTRTAAILVTIRTIFPPVLAPIFATVLTPIFAAVFSAVFATILTTRGLVGLAGDGDRGQQRAGYEQGTEQTVTIGSLQAPENESTAAGWPPL